MAKTVRRPDVGTPELLNRVKTSAIAGIRKDLVIAQGGRCVLCKNKLVGTKRPALDHDHCTGFIRDALCINCNGMEGKVFNLARRAGGTGNESIWLESLLAYYEKHVVPQHGGMIHPTHKTADEKRIQRNTKARNKRKISNGKKK